MEEGNFGKVRFALSLLQSEKTNPGDVICVEKSKSFQKFRDLKVKALNTEMYGKKSKDKYEPSAREIKAIDCEILFTITESAIKYYFASDIADIIKSPSSLDLSIVLSEGIDICHQNAYLMMEVLPQNTGKVSFNAEYIKNGNPKSLFLLMC